jgi:hypothetical protein
MEDRYFHHGNSVRDRQSDPDCIALTYGDNKQLYAEKVALLLNTADDQRRHNSELLMALGEAVAVIRDYLEYKHNGDPTVEDARLMGEMEINDYAADGRLDKAMELLKPQLYETQSPIRQTTLCLSDCHGPKDHRNADVENELSGRCADMLGQDAAHGHPALFRTEYDYLNIGHAVRLPAQNT